jgi:hypothetical protein
MKKGCAILMAAVLVIFATTALGYAGNNVEWFSIATPTNNHEIRIGTAPVNPQTVKSLEQARLEIGGEVFFTGQRLFVNDMPQHGGKIVAGWIPAGKAILMKKVAETAAYAEWQSVFVGECGNPTRQIHRREYKATIQSQRGDHRNQCVVPQPAPQPRLVQIRPVFPAERTVPIGYGPNGPIYGTQAGFLVGPFGPMQQFIPTGPVIPPRGYYWRW